MKKLIPQTGGHPFRLDDLIHIQNGLIESAAGIASAFNNGNQIALQGCGVTGINNDVAAGYIYYNNEIFKVNAVSLGGIPIGYSVYWNILEETESPTALTTPYLVQYQDTNFKGVHLRRTMVPFWGNGILPVPGVFSNAALPKLPAIFPKFTSLDTTNNTQNTTLSTHTTNIGTLTTDLNSVLSPWTTITMSGGDMGANNTAGQWQPGTVPANCVFKYKIIGKTIHIAISAAGSQVYNSVIANFLYRFPPALQALIGANALVGVGNGWFNNGVNPNFGQSNNPIASAWEFTVETGRIPIIAYVKTGAPFGGSDSWLNIIASLNKNFHGTGTDAINVFLSMTFELQ